MGPRDRLRPWLLLLVSAVALISIAALLLRRGPAPVATGVEAAPEPEASGATPRSARRPPRFDETPGLRAQVGELQAQLDQLRAEKERARKEAERACLTKLSSDCPLLDPTPEQLAEMARCGIVKMDLPYLDDVEPRADDDGKVTAESVTMAEVRRELGARVREELQGLHRAAGLGGVPPEKVRELMQVIGEGLPREGPDVERQLARERAGLGTPPAPESQGPRERFVRLQAGLGDEYEKALAEKLGPARARALRRAGNGWPLRMISSGQCEGDGDR